MTAIEFCQGATKTSPSEGQLQIQLHSEGMSSRMQESGGGGEGPNAIDRTAALQHMRRCMGRDRLKIVISRNFANLSVSLGVSDNWSGCSCDVKHSGQGM